MHDWLKFMATLGLTVAFGLLIVSAIAPLVFLYELFHNW